MAEWANEEFTDVAVNGRETIVRTVKIGYSATGTPWVACVVLAGDQLGANGYREGAEEEGQSRRMGVGAFINGAL